MQKYNSNSKTRSKSTKDHLNSNSAAEHSAEYIWQIFVIANSQLNSHNTELFVFYQKDSTRLTHLPLQYEHIKLITM